MEGGLAFKRLTLSLTCELSVRSVWVCKRGRERDEEEEGEGVFVCV